MENINISNDDIQLPSPFAREKPTPIVAIPKKIKSNAIVALSQTSAPAESYVINIIDDKQSHTAYKFEADATDTYLIAALLTGFFGWSSLYCILAR